MVEPGSRVLDIGCGDGELLDILVNERGADARGLELSREGVSASVARGLSVVQGNADTDLVDYPSDGFDYVILSQTLQAMRDTRECLRQMLRIGKRTIVSFPNFGHWRVRLKLLLGGRMPETETLDLPWYNTPNIHLCTIRDFVNLCEDLGITIEQSYTFTHYGKLSSRSMPLWYTNLFGDQGLFVLSYDDDGLDEWIDDNPAGA
ncbi:MAG: methionine biosynthesis protein MetW [Alphaproteobacteria bacterium]|nr:MAG: methionine biosynthesis protein MetW [Alphaproteobacteria bacterium]